MWHVYKKIKTLHSPPWEFRSVFNTSDGSRWHEEKNPFNKSVFGSNCPITVSDVGWKSYNEDELSNKFILDDVLSAFPELQTEFALPNPLQSLRRNHSRSPTKRPISIIVGAHGAWDGKNWNKHERLNIDESSVKSSLRLLSYVQRKTGAVQKNNGQFHYLDNLEKNCFESRLRLYDLKKMSKIDFEKMISNSTHHVILGFCFSRNDIIFRANFLRKKILRPVTSYIGHMQENNNFITDYTRPKHLSFVAPRGTLFERNGNRTDISNKYILYQSIDENTSRYIIMQGDAISLDRYKEYANSKKYAQCIDDGNLIKIWIPPVNTNI